MLKTYTVTFYDTRQAAFNAILSPTVNAVGVAAAIIATKYLVAALEGEAHGGSYAVSRLHLVI